MNDDILNRFIEKLVTQNIDEDIFRENINVFSRFLGYSNSDLPKYISNFPYFTGFPACALAK